MLMMTKQAKISYTTSDGTIDVPDTVALPCEASENYDYTYFYMDEVELVYTLPENMILTDIEAENPSQIDILVYNYTAEEYVLLKDVSKNGDGTLEDYVCDGRLKVRYENKHMQFEAGRRTPRLSLKGAARQ